LAAARRDSAHLPPKIWVIAQNSLEVQAGGRTPQNCESKLADACSAHGRFSPAYCDLCLHAEEEEYVIWNQ
jgi:hypothetical protein